MPNRPSRRLLCEALPEPVRRIIAQYPQIKASIGAHPDFQGNWQGRELQSGSFWAGTETVTNPKTGKPRRFVQILHRPTPGAYLFGNFFSDLHRLEDVPKDKEVRFYLPNSPEHPLWLMEKSKILTVPGSKRRYYLLVCGNYPKKMDSEPNPRTSRHHIQIFVHVFPYNDKPRLPKHDLMNLFTVSLSGYSPAPGAKPTRYDPLPDQPLSDIPEFRFYQWPGRSDEQVHDLLRYVFQKKFFKPQP